jgi:hypothetical protein
MSVCDDVMVVCGAVVVVLPAQLPVVIGVRVVCVSTI